jgi:hypothetical protein
MGRWYLLAPLLAAVGCASGHIAPDSGPGDDVTIDASGAPDVGCIEACDADHDGVNDPVDQCPDTPQGADINQVGCADSQVDPTLNPDFPPYGLTWTPTGDPGRAGGLTWNYTGIDRADLFHIYWVICDDPADPCGVSLDGPIDLPAEHWVFSGAQSNLPAGHLVFTNTTHILLDDGSSPTLSGRLTVNIQDASQAAIPFTDVVSLGITARDGTHGAEITGTGFNVTVAIDVQEGANPFTPYLDYYDAQVTPMGGSTSVSFGGYFYDE